MTIALLIGGTALAPAAQGQSSDGRVLVSLLHSEQPGFLRGGSIETNEFLNLVDATNRSTLAQGIELDVGTSLRYEAEPWGGPGRGFTDTDLLRSRFFADVRAEQRRTAWRLHGQFVPWQRTQPTPDIPRRRDVQVGLDFLPRNLPQLLFNFTRADRETQAGLSSSEDRRADLRFARGNFGTNLGVRRIETTPSGRTPGTKTDEFRAGLLGGSAWRRMSWSGTYDALVLHTGTRERDVDQLTHNLNGGVVWALHRKVTVGGNGLTRWLRTADNARPAPDETRELYLALRADTRPVTGLAVSLLREYRESRTTAGDVVADYARLEALYQRDVVRSTMFQTGLQQTFDLRSRGGGLPNNSAFALVDGMLRRGVNGRAELRLATTTPVETGLQWRGLLQLRTQPSPRSNFDVLWHVDQLPEIAGEQQRDRTLELVAGYQPTAGTSLVGTHRRLDGTGRIQRDERFWSLNGSWRTSQYSTLSVYASTRQTHLQLLAAQETIVGLDLTWWARENLRVRGTWRQVRGPGENRSYGVILTRDF